MHNHTCFTCQKSFQSKRAPLNQERAFCSRSCSAKTNNKLYPKRFKKAKMMYCINCGAQLRRSLLYCSNNCQGLHKQKLAVKEWLDTGVLNSSTSHGNHYARRHILAQQLNKCALCSMENAWQDRELHFVLDHIDGNSENNCRSNLRLVCPNCDSQLSTFKSRNKGNGRISRRDRYRRDKSS